MGDGVGWGLGRRMGLSLRFYRWDHCRAYESVSSLAFDEVVVVKNLYFVFIGSGLTVHPELFGPRLFKFLSISKIPSTRIGHGLLLLHSVRGQLFLPYSALPDRSGFRNGGGRGRWQMLNFLRYFLDNLMTDLFLFFSILASKISFIALYQMILIFNKIIKRWIFRSPIFKALLFNLSKKNLKLKEMQKHIIILLFHSGIVDI